MTVLTGRSCAISVALATETAQDRDGSSEGDSSMQKMSLEALARDRLDAARRSNAGRASETVVGGHERVMRQTVVALLAGHSLNEHENPGEASVYVLSGRVELHAGGDQWEARTGDLVEVPAARHSLHALEDSVILLTAVLRGHPAD
jgi:quercetin dioxygenase-like cupin family protein